MQLYDVYLLAAQALTTAEEAFTAAVAAAVAPLLNNFVAVAHTSSPTSSTGWKFRANTSGGTVNLHLTGALGNNQLLVVSAVAGTNSIVITTSTLAGSPTIWDPSTSAFGSTATLTNADGDGEAIWQYDKANNQFVQLSGGGGSGSAAAGWTPVTHAQSPYTAPAGVFKFAVDSTGGPVDITLGSVPADKQFVTVAMVTGTNLITMTPASGTIADPNSGNAQEASASITVQGSTVTWQEDLANTRLIAFAAA